MSFSKPKVPAYNPPATKPERQVDVEPEDVQLGDNPDDTTQKKGKRSLMRPTGVSATSGAPTGLSV